MSLKVGIVGLPNVGKSTLFNGLLKKQVANAQNYPFTTIEPNVGIVEVPDERLEKLKEVIEKSEGLSPSFKIVPAVVEFVDIAGLVKGAHKGEGLGNKFLSHIREVDAIVFVVRDFKNKEIIDTGENPSSDLEILKSELLLKDLETVEKRVDTLERELKPLSPADQKHGLLDLVNRVKTAIEQGKWVGDEFTGDELEKIYDLQLLSSKKTLIVVNSDEGSLNEEPPVAGAMRICAKLEEELGGLEPDEQKEYMGELGIKEPGLESLIKMAYETLGLETYLTAGPKEVRAWTIKKGSLAPVAAGVIHTDFERGFIAADVVSFSDFVESGGWKGAREKGKVKTIGKAEVVTEGMVVEFKFSV
jgi:hypothetical protein